MRHVPVTTALNDSVETRQSQPLKEIPALRVRDGMGGIRTFRGDQLGFLRSGIDQFGDIYRFRLLNMRVVMLNHPDYIRHVLVDKSEQYDKNAAVFRIARPVLREGLIATADMELWRRQRRMMAPYFTPRMVSKFARNMTGETVSMLERWESRPDADAPWTSPTSSDSSPCASSAGRCSTPRSATRRRRSSGPSSSPTPSWASSSASPSRRSASPPPATSSLRRAIDRMDGFVSRFIQDRLDNEVAPGQSRPALPLPPRRGRGRRQGDGPRTAPPRGAQHLRGRLRDHHQHPGLGVLPAGPPPGGGRQAPRRTGRGARRPHRPRLRGPAQAKYTA
ncbi:cytochrome P450 (plasmid) [Streptomyces albidoflavus]|nr:cytochrome P450 [Streptomyces albidoflavus]